MSKLKEGDKAPAFKAKDQDGTTVSLADFKGKNLILYFYPGDDTPTCTKEACNYRDNYQSLLSQGFSVVGVSFDSEKSHKKFIKKYSLPFPLIADPDKKIIEDYGVWGEKTLFGRTYMATLRTTFIIDEKGIIKHIIEKVDSGHASQ
ncbi:MAG TPA: thioredoxin-dependent thiol peroxidase, partial [Mucilaginibacter sp.]|nr:thioredoxin-dependent thiol peroxidase [Mucilaginibacter sp.]